MVGPWRYGCCDLLPVCCILVRMARGESMTARIHPVHVRTCVLLLCAATGCAGAPPAPTLPSSPDAARSRQLQETLTRYNESVQAPAWAAAVVKGGRIV